VTILVAAPRDAAAASGGVTAARLLAMVDALAYVYPGDTVAGDSTLEGATAKEQRTSAPRRSCVLQDEPFPRASCSYQGTGATLSILTTPPYTVRRRRRRDDMRKRYSHAPAAALSRAWNRRV
jgi:hypothetical protein